jgi:rare lipoprotein A
MKRTLAAITFSVPLFFGVPATATNFQCEKEWPEVQEAVPCPEEAQQFVPSLIVPEEPSLPDLGSIHKLKGLASYYSDFFDGRRTANGEIFHQARFSAAHRTLPMGCLVEVRALATGRTIKLRVNDRGPFKGGFTLDLSRAAAHALGVDMAEDRRVEIRVLALPGEQQDSSGVAATIAEREAKR